MRPIIIIGIVLLLIAGGVVLTVNLVNQNQPELTEQVPDVQLPALMPARIDVPYTEELQKTILDMEDVVFDYTNLEREAYGLQPLIRNDTLDTIAREHSADMVTYAYTEHTDSLGRSPTDRAKQAGFPCLKPYGDITYDGVGENLCALGYGRISGYGDVDKYDSKKLGAIMVLSLMDSQKHQDNILNPVYTHIGVGIEYGYGVYYLTQDFW